MNKLGLIIFLFFINTHIHCQTLDSLKYTINDSLTIKGDNIWVRSKPMTGTVVFTLNDGNVCNILEKGDKQSIGTVTDYWYLISFKNQKGWVFGSQTSIKQGKNSSDFKTYLHNILDKHFFGIGFDYWTHRSQARDLKNKNIGYFRLYNPGTTCRLEPYKLFENYDKEQEPEMPKAIYFENEMPIDGFCRKSNSSDGVYFKEVKNFPSYIVKTFEPKEIELPERYKRGKKMKVVILYGSMIIKTLYFIAADNNWSLVVIDDCDCSA